jgi:1-acyl-sn-glycerol-3-phosphate acyltransferase
MGRKMQEDNTMVYAATRALIRFLFWIFTELEVDGLEHVPEAGPVLLVSNHVNLMDPIVPIGVLKRRVSFMAKEQIFQWPIMGPWFKALDLVPVARGSIASRRAIQRAEELLARGWIVGVYPEGTRSRQPGMGPAHHGAALLAMRTGVPILPVAITGTHMVLQEGKSFPRRNPVAVRSGETFSVPQHSGKMDRRAMEELTERIMRRIAALLPPEYRGVYAVERATARIVP